MRGEQSRLEEGRGQRAKKAEKQRGGQGEAEKAEGLGRAGQGRAEVRREQRRAEKGGKGRGKQRMVE